jgi:hypothetical protein
LLREYFLLRIRMRFVKGLESGGLASRATDDRMTGFCVSRC